MPVTTGKKVGERSRRKISMCSFRVEPRLKEELQIIAKKRDRSLSSLIEQAVKDFLESQESEFQSPATPKDRRQHLRKEVLLPARWRLKSGKERVEHDVLIKNISGGGAYTEYMNGRVYRIFENDQPSSLELVVRLPGSQEHVVFECEPKRFHVTKESVGVGLRYTKLTDRKSLVALTEFLT